MKTATDMTITTHFSHFSNQNYLTRTSMAPRRDTARAAIALRVADAGAVCRDP